MEERLCPYCNYNEPLSTHMHDEVIPEDGDISICINCCGVSIFIKNCTSLEKITEKDRKLIKNWDEIELYQTLIKKEQNARI